MNIITVASSKGGVGKTTTAVTLASGLANLEPTLLVDFDSHGFCAICYGLDKMPGVYAWLSQDKPLPHCLIKGRPANLDILPSDSLTKAVEIFIKEDEDLIQLVTRMQNPYGEMRRYAFVVIDTADSGILQEVAIAAASQLVIPFECESMSITGVGETLALARTLNPLAPTTFVPTAFDKRLSDHRLNLGVLAEQLGDEHGEGMVEPVPVRSAVKWCSTHGKTIWEHEGSGIEDVRRAYNVTIKRVWALSERENGGHNGQRA